MTLLFDTSEGARLLTDAVPVGIFETDLGGHVVYANPAWTDITGVTVAGAARDGLESCLHPADKGDVLADWKRALERCEEYGGRFRVFAGGVTKWVDARMVPTRTADDVVGWVGSLVDVTASAEAELSNERLRDEAVEVARIKSEFVANISHEIRTPLNAILGLSDILRGTALDDKQRSYVDTMRQAGDDLLNLLNDILDISKAEAGAMDLEAAPFDVVEMVDHVADLFEASARGKGLGLDVHCDQNMPRALIGDRMRLRQVVSNLVANAIKFTDGGGVTLNVAADSRDPDSVGVRIDVSDTGPGIPAAQQERIFEAFRQVDASSTRRASGSGLGLAIARRIVELMHGSLTVESEMGRGSTFSVRVTLPTQEPVVPVEPRSLPVAPRVLIVEDNAMNQLVLHTMLRKLGCEVETADNGAIGVECVAGSGFDLVFMDCQMPVMDGYEATGAIRALGAPNGMVPIVALTASSTAEDRERCLAAGMDEYLSKPVSLDELRGALTRFVLSPTFARVSESSGGR